MVMKLKNKKGLSQYILSRSLVIEKALIFLLEALVADLQNHAKLNAGYEDQTSNLKGSIGGVVLKNGKPITYKGFDTDGKTGNITGLEFINNLISGYGSGYVILIVAGMEYGSYVEDLHNLNVLKKSELKMNRELSNILQGLKVKIDNMN